MRRDAIWCILRHNFEKCYSVRTDLVASGWFFRYSYLYTVMITIFLGGSWAIFFFLGGGKLLPHKYPRYDPQIGPALIFHKTSPRTHPNYLQQNHYCTWEATYTVLSQGWPRMKLRHQVFVKSRHYGKPRHKKKLFYYTGVCINIPLL